MILHLDLNNKKANMLTELQARVGAKYNLYMANDLKNNGSDRSAFVMKIINFLQNFWSEMINFRPFMVLVAEQMHDIPR